ncbi:hypothetical protein MKX01_004803 [Papaver californicum]|nr:hypothetical protein MKX01_004803 [Papaver californicum]
MFLSKSWVLLIFINIITITSNFHQTHNFTQLKPGTRELLVANVVISSMHTAVTHYGTVVLLDRTNIGPSRRMLRKGHCRYSPNDRVLKHDCYSGQFLPDGTLLQTGGDLDGLKKIRKFNPCERNEFCDCGKWYSTNQILPDGSVVIVGGRAANSIEFYPPREPGILPLQFPADLKNDQNGQNGQFVPLCTLMFAFYQMVIYLYSRIIEPYNMIIRPILLYGDYTSAVIVVCGGAEYGAFIQKSTDTPAHGSCGRIVATDPNPVWEMEDMPFGKIMGDMVMLPTGDALIINGAQSGSQGFELGTNPCLYPLLYRPSEPVGFQFMTLDPATVPRMYHSTTDLLPYGRVLVAGSNPYYFYKYGGDFPTELWLEAFSPEYLQADRANVRPAIEELPEKLCYGQAFEIFISVTLPIVGTVEVSFGNAPFATHSYSQGQRLVKLGVTSAIPESGGAGGGRYRIGCTAPPNSKVAPPGYYMVFAVNRVASYYMVAGIG